MHNISKLLVLSFCFGMLVTFKANAQEVRICDGCNDVAMETVAEAHAIQYPQSHGVELMVISPRTGKFREFTVSSSAGGGGFDFFGSGSPNVTMKSIRSNQFDQEANIKSAFDTIVEIGTYLNQDINLPASSGYTSAAHGLLDLEAAGVKVTNHLLNDAYIKARKIQVSVLLRETSLSAGASAVVVSASASLAVYPTFVTVLFADKTSQLFEVNLQWRNGDLAVNLTGTKFAYDANGDAIPLLNIELTSITFRPGQIDGQAVLGYLDSLKGVRVTDWNPLGGWGRNAGCIAVQCKNETHSDGRPGVACNPIVLDMCN